MSGPLTIAREIRERFEIEALPYRAQLLSVARYFTRNEKDAEDLVQDTLLKAFRKYHQFAAGTNLKAWLLRILANTFYNQCRRRKIAGSPVVTDDVEALAPGAERPVRAQDFGAADLDRFKEYLDDEVKAALWELPREFREVLVLLAIDERSYKEISAILGIPIGTVMSRLHRGRRFLQARLAAYARGRNLPGVRPEAAVA